jgi:hypothetical protein
LPGERFEVELAVPRFLRLSCALLCCKTLLLFLPSLGLLFLLYIMKVNERREGC